MNVEGAAVEHALGRTIMPRFHAGFSCFGTWSRTSSGSCSWASACRCSPSFGVVAVGALLLVWGRGQGRSLRWPCTRDRRPGPLARVAGTSHVDDRTDGAGPSRLPRAPPTMAGGGVVDGYDDPAWVGVAGFGVFVTSMTGGRIAGPMLLDRFGRPVVSSGPWSPVARRGTGGVRRAPGGAVIGIVLWGVGTSLGFPVGMSAAADDPVQAAARVGVVAAIGYTAFLAGPPWWAWSPTGSASCGPCWWSRCCSCRRPWWCRRRGPRSMPATSPDPVDFFSRECCPTTRPGQFGAAIGASGRGPALLGEGDLSTGPA